MGRIYGPDAFTVGSDTELSAYDSDWSKFWTSSEDLDVENATDDVRCGTVDNYGAYRWTGQTLQDGQEIRATFDGSGITQFGTYLNLTVRSQAANLFCYMVQYLIENSTVILYRIEAGTPYTQTMLDSGGVTAYSSSYDVYFNAKGTGAEVFLEAGDDSNGDAVVQAVDTDAGRYTSGQPGVAIFEDNIASSGGIDDVSIYDLTPTVVVTNYHDIQ